jgi:hypothetical protein
MGEPSNLSYQASAAGVVLDWYPCEQVDGRAAMLASVVRMMFLDRIPGDDGHMRA